MPLPSVLHIVTYLQCDFTHMHLEIYVVVGFDFDLPIVKEIYLAAAIKTFPLKRENYFCRQNLLGIHIACTVDLKIKMGLPYFSFFLNTEL